GAAHVPHARQAPAAPRVRELLQRLLEEQALLDGDYALVSLESPGTPLPPVEARAPPIAELLRAGRDGQELVGPRRHAADTLQRVGRERALRGELGAGVHVLDRAAAA